MRIQHNIAALNASNRLKANDSSISKNIAKLSSGYRINSAADDAAGLAVSEKMRSQINGLNQAEDNASNGISLVQTAEGGLNETESILQRMNTLAVESANGTYQSDTDRANLQKEVAKLQDEINTISTSTNFNQISLLNGSLGGYSVAVTSGSYTSTGLENIVVTGGYSLASVGLTVTYTSTTSMSVDLTSTITGISFTTASTSFTSGGTYTFKAVINGASVAADTAKEYDGMEVTVTMGTGTLGGTTVGVTASSSGSALSLQVGADNKTDQRINLSIADMSAKGLKVDTVDISTQPAAQTAIDTIKKAINTVSATRADLGAVQNQLEHTSNNLSTMSENLTSAESSIRDVDMSDEYVQYSKNQILSQAATAMLAQANTQPQNVLTLLKG